MELQKSNYEPTREELKFERTYEYDPEYVKENNVKCIKCEVLATVCFFEEDWNGIDLCNECYKEY